MKAFIILQTPEQWDVFRPMVYVLLALAVVFFAIREAMLWYWKVNEIVKNQNEQIRLLRKMAGEPELKKESDSSNETEIVT